ncbi:MAG: YggU family protein [Porticoccaceae bacterium]|nr:YggU family protein [Porticoccaceae bacterium]OUS04868.1 YggU family protein [Gammaproteobacteria bacterium 54_18_T64]
MPHFLWQEAETLVLHCHVQPKASRDALAGLYGERLKVQITAPPVDGKANKHLLKYIAKEFGVAKSRVALVRGESSRLKTLEIARPQKIPAAAQITQP